MLIGTANLQEGTPVPSGPLSALEEGTFFKAPSLPAMVHYSSRALEAHHDSCKCHDRRHASSMQLDFVGG